MHNPKVPDVRSTTREFTVFIAAQIALGAASWWASSQSWRTTLTEVIAEDLGTTLIESGAIIVPFLSVNAVVSLVGVLGIIATRTWGRRVIGAVAAAISVATLVSLLSINSEGLAGWIAFSSALAVGLIVTNTWAVFRGAGWPMLGRKYERQTREQEPTDPWSALDRGIDPTLD